MSWKDDVWGVRNKKQIKTQKVRNPVEYLTQKHGVSIRYAKEFLAQPAVISEYWKEDSSGPYIHSDYLDMIGYGWNKERQVFMESLESTEEVREVSRKAMKEDYGKVLSKKEIDKRIKDLPKKYQKRLMRTQRIMREIE